MAPKRKATDPFEDFKPLADTSANKRTKQTISHDWEDVALEEFPLEELRIHARELRRNLQQQDAELIALRQKVETLTTALKQASAQQVAISSASAQTKNLSPEKLAERATKLGDTIANGIKKQMKWQPSCKQGRTKWSYESSVPDPAIFYALFPTLPSDGKAWKQKKMPVGDFMNAVGRIQTSCRYNYLSITGEEINVKWDKEEGSIKLSGTYGL